MSYIKIEKFVGPIPKRDMSYYRSPEWAIRKREVWYRDKATCQNCEMKWYPGTPYEYQVHHRNYDHFGDEWDSDLVLLCDLCHQWVHGLRDCNPGCARSIDASLQRLLQDW